MGIAIAYHKNRCDFGALPWPSNPCFFGEKQGKLRTEMQGLFCSEPLKSLEKKEKHTKKNKGTRKTTKGRKSKKVRIGGSGYKLFPCTPSDRENSPTPGNGRVFIQSWRWDPPKLSRKIPSFSQKYFGKFLSGGYPNRSSGIHRWGLDLSTRRIPKHLFFLVFRVSTADFGFLCRETKVFGYFPEVPVTKIRVSAPSPYKNPTVTWGFGGKGQYDSGQVRPDKKSNSLSCSPQVCLDSALTIWGLVESLFRIRRRGAVCTAGRTSGAASEKFRGFWSKLLRCCPKMHRVWWFPH